MRLCYIVFFLIFGSVVLYNYCSKYCFLLLYGSRKGESWGTMVCIGALVMLAAPYFGVAVFVEPQVAGCVFDGVNGLFGRFNPEVALKYFGRTFISGNTEKIVGWHSGNTYAEAVAMQKWGRTFLITKNLAS